MNYDERIAALKSFKSTITSAGGTTDNVSGVSSEISAWEGNAKTKFDEYINEVKKLSKNIAGRKSSFLAAVDGQITALVNQLEFEVQSYKYVVNVTYDSKDSTKNRALKRQSVANLYVDESVKKRLLQMIG
ncbi:hypothetical protein [Streptococcus intermedius]|uniref:hypothetical protein n=1 Tax=Streptococcus intermedius TaxID=1338 RepID=UPI0020013565|nr:hypothetical protein [Streptococcus intermedius]